MRFLAHLPLMCKEHATAISTLVKDIMASVGWCVEERERERLTVHVQMANPALQARHWTSIFAIVEQPFEEGQAVCVDGLLQAGVLDKLEEVQTVTQTATKEFSMLKMLEKMEAVRPLALAVPCMPRLLSLPGTPVSARGAVR